MATPTPDRRSIELAQALLKTTPSIPGRRMLDALVYLLDRQLGGAAPFTSTYFGPRYPELEEELSRWQITGNAVVTIIQNDRPTDPLDGQHITITRRVGHRGHEMAVRSDLSEAARELWTILQGVAKDQVGLTSTRVAVAARLVQCREFGLKQPFAELIDQFRWARVTPADYQAGIALARALGYR